MRFISRPRSRTLLALPLLTLLLLTMLPLRFANSQTTTTENIPAAVQAPTLDELQNLIRRDTVIGTGREAVIGSTVEVHYEGWLYNAKARDLKGTLFDSSRARGKAFSFPLGAGRVIKGWDQGVAGMKVGGKRTLIIPGYLAYGGRGAGNGLIPPDAILLFEVELLNVR